MFAVFSEARCWFAASWLPPNRAYRCTYVSRQIEVKAAYGLWVTPEERDAMTRVLSEC